MKTTGKAAITPYLALTLTVLLSLILVLSFFLSRRSMLPWLLYVLLCLLILLLQKDLGTALLYFCSALLLYWASSGNVPVSMLGLAAGAGRSHRDRQ